MTVTAAGPRGRLPVLLGGAAAVLLAVAVTVVVTRPSGEDALVAGPAAQVPADCPAELALADQDAAVPDPPSTGPGDRLVPDGVPDAVLVCRYADSSGFAPGRTQRATSVPLEGEQVLRGGLEQVPGDLAVPRTAGYGSCTQMGGATLPHLVRLEYPSGAVWISTSTDPNGCAPVTNGAFTSAVFLGRQVSASYDAGAWVAPPPQQGSTDACRLSRTGRAGQEDVLVPDGWQALELCLDGTLRTVPADRARAVAGLLAGLPSESGGGSGASCQDQLAVPGADEHLGLLVWRYPSGRDVLGFLFLGCEPPVGSLTRSATATLEEQTELVRLLRGD